MEQAEWWFGKMVKERVTPDEKTYNCLINACAQKAEVKQAEWWFGEMVKEIMTPDEKTHNSVMNACA